MNKQLRTIDYLLLPFYLLGFFVNRCREAFFPLFKFLYFLFQRSLRFSDERLLIAIQAIDRSPLIQTYNKESDAKGRKDDGC